jgi:Spx/MgsR family transcriptional regulator
MAPVRIYLYANCSSCKNAESMIRDAEPAFERRDIFKQKLSPQELRDLLAEIGKSPGDVLSTRSIPYRELGLVANPVSDDELIDLMAIHPGLLKRPIIIVDQTVQVGFNRTALAALLQSYGKDA